MLGWFAGDLESCLNSKAPRASLLEKPRRLKREQAKKTGFSIIFGNSTHQASGHTQERRALQIIIFRFHVKLLPRCVSLSSVCPKLRASLCSGPPTLLLKQQKTSTKIWLFSPHVYNYMILISRTLQTSTSCHDSFCSYSSKGIPDRHFSSHSNFLLQIDSLECFITATASFCCFLFTASQVTLQCCWLPVVAVSAAWNKPWSRAALLLPGDATGLDGCESDYGMIEKHDDTKLEDKDQNIQVAAFSSCKVQYSIFVCIRDMSICLPSTQEQVIVEGCCFRRLDNGWKRQEGASKLHHSDLGGIDF